LRYAADTDEFFCDNTELCIMVDAAFCRKGGSFGDGIIYLSGIG